MIRTKSKDSFNIESFKLPGHDQQGKTLTLAEELDSEDMAGHFRDHPLQHLNIATSDC